MHHDHAACKNSLLAFHSFIYLYSIDHTDVEIVMGYNYKL